MFNERAHKEYIKKKRTSWRSFLAEGPQVDLAVFQPVLQWLPIERICGTYVLCRNGKPVYVGRSVDVVRRIVKHQEKLKFDDVFYVACSQDASMIVENVLIQLLRPKLNRMPGGKMVDPYELAGKIGWDLRPPT